jgi:NTP pyrophosphatase (non-canonical NTP hydrolase)
MTLREQDIIQWGRDRNLVGPTGVATIYGQLKKTREEVQELDDACEAYGKSYTRDDVKKATDSARDAIGDIYVTLVMHAQLWGLTMTECIEQAWSQIKDRKGRMVNGIFVKETPSCPTSSSTI